MNKRCESFILVLSLVVMVLSLWASSGCSTWQKDTATAIDVTRRLTELGNSAHRAHCDEVLASCIAAKENPCARLDKCNDDRRKVVKIRVTILEALGAAFDAVKVGNKTGALFALDVAQGALTRLQSIVKVWEEGK